MQPIEGFGISKVIDSDDPDFKPGDLVSGLTGWEEYSLIRKNHQLRKIEQHDVPLSYHLGLLGMFLLLYLLTTWSISQTSLSDTFLRVTFH